MSKTIKKGEAPSTVDEAAEWYFRQDGGAFSPLEKHAFEQWLAASTANRQAYDEIGMIWAKLGLIERPAVTMPDARPRLVTRRTSFRRPFAFAAAACVLLVAGYALDLPMRLQADAITGTGETRTVTLDDGSSVVLNTNSAIAVNYNRAFRRIRLLRGEAVFTVAKDADRPFLVDAANGEARALGTAFAVRETADSATVTVLESRVGIAYPASTPPSVELSPGEAVEFSPRGIGSVHTVDIDAATAWQRGKLIFVDRTLGSVVAELNRYHTGRIQITDPTISGQIVSGVFNIGDTVQVLDALEASLGLHSTRLTNFLILLHR